MQADVVVIGAGLAGMRAALAAEEAGARVVLIDRGAIGTGTNSALSNGAFAWPGTPGTAAAYVDLIVQIGRGLNRRPYVWQVAREAPAAMEFLRTLGLEIRTTASQWLVQAERRGVIPGLSLVRSVARLVERRGRIRITRGLHVTALLRGSRQMAGAGGFDLGGAERAVRAPAVVLACGGAGAIYAKHDNQATMLGTGYRLAAQAGLDLWDMEFVQFYPLVLDEPGWPSMMIYPPYPRHVRLLDARGADLLSTHGLGDINQAIVRKRDAFAALLVEEAKAGPVCMDLRGVPGDEWDRHPLSLLRRFQAECRARPIRITPAAHFCMGGVRTDEDGHTAVPGLFACGEMVWGLHGANRMGGNALLECLVSGRIAGRAAARFAASRSAEGAVEPVPPPRATAAETPDFRTVRRHIQETAWRCAGVIRSAASMALGLSEAEALHRAVQAARAETLRDRTLREDLLSAAFALRAVLAAGRQRDESRGCFIRADYPQQDDGKWRKNSRLSWDPQTGDFSVAYLPADGAGEPEGGAGADARGAGRTPGSGAGAGA